VTVAALARVAPTAGVIAETNWLLMVVVVADALFTTA